MQATKYQRCKRAYTNLKSENKYQTKERQWKKAVCHSVQQFWSRYVMMARYDANRPMLDKPSDNYVF